MSIKKIIFTVFAVSVLAPPKQYETIGGIISRPLVYKSMQNFTGAQEFLIIFSNNHRERNGNFTDYEFEKAINMLKFIIGNYYIDPQNKELLREFFSFMSIDAIKDLMIRHRDAGAILDIDGIRIRKEIERRSEVNSQSSESDEYS